MGKSENLQPLTGGSQALHGTADADRVLRIHKASIGYHELCQSRREEAALLLLGALAGEAHDIRSLGVHTAEEAEMLQKRVQEDLRLLALDDDAELCASQK